MTNPVTEITELAHRLENRLDGQVISDVVEYVRVKLCKLALEILCEQVYECEVRITKEECQRLQKLSTELDLHLKVVDLLHTLVK